MQLHLRPGKRACIVIGLVSLIALTLMITGCTQPTPSGTTPVVTTPVPSSGATSAATPATSVAVPSDGKKMVTFTEKDTGTTQQIASGSRFAIQLAENPTTGYMWNATTTSGLEILSTDFVENAHAEGMTGVGGIRTWILRTTGPGESSFKAIYGRSWEPVTGSETAYFLTLNSVSV